MMTRTRAGLVLVALTLAVQVARAQVPATTAPARQRPEPADVPAAKLKGGVIDPGFARMHESFLARGKAGPIGVLFLGDSITQGWGNAKDVWQQHYGADAPANFGIGGDRTEHVLWRMDHGELDGIHPMVVVLLIGTNNIGYPAADITRADEKIVAQLHAKLPQAKVLVLGIFPRGMDPKDPNVAGMREKITRVNARLAKLDDGNRTRFLDIGDKFVAAGGVLPKEVMPDALHPNHAGYVIWADAMQPLLDQMLR